MPGLLGKKFPAPVGQYSMRHKHVDKEKETDILPARPMWPFYTGGTRSSPLKPSFAPLSVFETGFQEHALTGGYNTGLIILYAINSAAGAMMTGTPTLPKSTI